MLATNGKLPLYRFSVNIKTVNTAIIFTRMTVKTRAWGEGYDPPVDLLKLGGIFREARERQNLSRARLSELSGIPTSTLQQVEGGGNPELRTLIRLADALGLSLAEAISQASQKERNAVTPPVPELVHNANSTEGEADASGSNSADDIRLLQRVALAILHLVGAPDIRSKD